MSFGPVPSPAEISLFQAIQDKKDIRKEPEYQELKASLAKMTKEKRDMLSIVLEDLKVLDSRDFVTSDQASELLHLSKPCIRMWIRQGKIKAQRFGGRWRIPLGEINRLLTADT